MSLANQTERFTITGSSGIDSITAGSGNDTIVGAQNDTLLDGGTGTDQLNVGNFNSSSDAQIINIETIRTDFEAVVNLSDQTRDLTFLRRLNLPLVGVTAIQALSQVAPVTIRSSTLPRMRR